jgi:DNA-binding response OmpR family regulator
LALVQRVVRAHSAVSCSRRRECALLETHRRRDPRIRCGDLELDRLERRALLAGVDLRLTEREFTLLAYLADRADHAVRRADLLAKIWILPDDYGANIVDVYVRRLRHKLGAQAGLLRTVRGFGYCLRSAEGIQSAHPE